MASRRAFARLALCHGHWPAAASLSLETCVLHYHALAAGALHTSPHTLQQRQPSLPQDPENERRASGAHASTASGGDDSASSSGSAAAAALAPRPNWLMRTLPEGAAPYAELMRLDKPIGTWLLLWPGLWSIALAAPPGHLPDPWISSLFCVGAVLLRGAGCTVNDLWDRDIDARVARTRTRPLARGAVSPERAVALLAATLTAGLGVLLQLNGCAQALGASSLALVGTYPLMKRITNWPQAYLGLTINWGALMGYAAVTGACDWAIVGPLYAAGVCWTLVYDTIYAHQDKRDDVAVGVKSTALHFGASTKRWLSGFAVAQAAALGAAGAAAGAGAPFAAAVAAGAAHQAWQVRSVDLDDGPDCAAKFVSNKWYGAIIYAGIVGDRLLLATPAVAHLPLQLAASVVA